MKTNKKVHLAIISITILLSVSCEEFVDIEAPNDKLIRSVVFDSEETALSALIGIYNELGAASYSNGGTNSIGYLTGISADDILNIAENNLPRMEFQRNELLPDNQLNYYLWSSAYNIIYLTNSFLEGITSTEQISQDLKDQWEGEVRFIRAFTYFYLVNLYGEVPLLLTSDYRDNELAGRDSQEAIYSSIKEDLHIAINQLPDGYTRGERTQVNSFAAMGLLARVYLYLEDWEMAETLSSQVISQTSLYKFPADINEVFKANSSEALWQISPIGGSQVTTHTPEGRTYIIEPGFSFFATVKLNEDLVNDFQETDERLKNWVEYDSSLNAYYSYKYKIWNSTTFPIEEYSMILRLSEQYLIRAEARTHLGKLTSAMDDLDIIKERAGIPLFSDTDQETTKQNLIKEILKERRRELFTEWGHRWFDIKRTGNANEVFGKSNPFWQETDVYYPIPEEERKKNPSLSQNDGY